MGVKCTHYKLCSVQSKLVYFLQFWGMKHFLWPVCDIWPYPSSNQLLWSELLIRWSERWPLHIKVSKVVNKVIILYKKQTKATDFCNNYCHLSLLQVTWIENLLLSSVFDIMIFCSRNWCELPEGGDTRKKFR